MWLKMAYIYSVRVKIVLVVVVLCTLFIFTPLFRDPRAKADRLSMADIHNSIQLDT